LPLSRLESPSKSCVQPRSRFVGLPRARCRPPVSMQMVSFLVELPSPEPASSRFILPWRPSSSEFLRSLLPPAAFVAGTPTQGLFPHRGITGARPLVAKDAMPSLRSGLRFSQPLDGFLRPPALQASFIPQPRPGLSPFRGFSPRAAALAHRQPVPPCRCHPEPSPDFAWAFRFRVPPATGCHALDASTSRPSSARGRVAYGLGFSQTAARSPLRFSSPPGRPPPPWFWFTQNLPLTTLPPGL
jgi:hypothetical protein